MEFFINVLTDFHSDIRTEILIDVLMEFLMNVLTDSFRHPNGGVY